MFAVLGSMMSIEGLTVADLFAGSGALGIEALSRGAARAVLVDADRRAIETIRANLERTGLAGPGVEVVQADVLRWLDRLDRSSRFDLVLCDPPYSFSTWPDLLDRLAPVSGTLVVESGVGPESGASFEQEPAWEVLKVKRYGGTVVTVARPGPNTTWADQCADKRAKCEGET
jgi:16S rRNA (guanine966-N2)-methyltransferase